jgi:predicted RNA-binding Zn ribbon-like protein
MLVEAAMAFVDVIRTDQLDRLRVCAGTDCADVLVDLSKNRSRRFCESGCGNRANVAAYRARQTEPRQPTG